MLKESEGDGSGKQWIRRHGKALEASALTTRDPKSNLWKPLMSPSEEFTTLLALLRQGTEKRILAWDKTPSPEVFRVDLDERTSARIVKDESFTEEGGDPYFVLTLVNQEGRVIEEWDSRGLDQQAGDFAELYQLARRSATNSDKELSRILTNLEHRILQEGT